MARVVPIMARVLYIAAGKFQLCLGLARTQYIYGEITVYLSGKSPNIRSYTAYIYYIYGSGQS